MKVYYNAGWYYKSYSEDIQQKNLKPWSYYYCSVDRKHVLHAPSKAIHMQVRP